jgi:hypothetical protein
MILTCSACSNEDLRQIRHVDLMVNNNNNNNGAVMTAFCSSTVTTKQ